MPEVHMMCGIAGSGKSHLALSLTKKRDAVYVSSDEIREQWYGDATIQGESSTVFTEIRNRIRRALKDGKTVVYDATNLSRRRRIHFIRNDVRGYPVTAHAVCPALSVCLARNRNRNRKVKEEVIHHMYQNFEIPFKEEGFTNVHYYPQTSEESPDKERFESLLTVPAPYQDLFDSFCQLEGFPAVYELPHDTKRHSFSVSRHLYHTLVEIKKTLSPKLDKELLWTGILHDLGKGETKSFLRFNGETRKYAGYEGHENVSAYLTIRILHHLGYPMEFICSVAKLVQFHHYFDIESKKKRKHASLILQENALEKLAVLQKANERAN